MGPFGRIVEADHGSNLMQSDLSVLTLLGATRYSYTADTDVLKQGSKEVNMVLNVHKNHKAY